MQEVQNSVKHNKSLFCILKATGTGLCAEWSVVMFEII